MQTLKTMEPYGLNIADSVYSAHTALLLSRSGSSLEAVELHP